ncbi:MAG TPA: TauD/TfdA family dioxygenase, partial [Acidimicrobiales bacterium]|nr:TauD/TfdA family dioxygenase [Acidimicrobiales bacterium]
YELPVFTEHDDRLFCRAIPPYIAASQRHADAPRIEGTKKRALQALVDMANDPANHVAMELQPGDIQLINNFHVLHGRTAYADDRSTHRVRHLKRLWLETESLTARPAVFEHRSSHWSDKRSASRLTVGGT